MASPRIAATAAARSLTSVNIDARQAEFQQWCEQQSDPSLAADALALVTESTKDPQRLLALAQNVYDGARADGEVGGIGAVGGGTSGGGGGAIYGGGPSEVANLSFGMQGPSDAPVPYALTYGGTDGRWIKWESTGTSEAPMGIARFTKSGLYRFEISFSFSSRDAHDTIPASVQCNLGDDNVGYSQIDFRRYDIPSGESYSAPGYGEAKPFFITPVKEGSALQVLISLYTDPPINLGNVAVAIDVATQVRNT